MVVRAARAAREEARAGEGQEDAMVVGLQGVVRVVEEQVAARAVEEREVVGWEAVARAAAARAAAAKAVEERAAVERVPMVAAALAELAVED